MSSFDGFMIDTALRKDREIEELNDKLRTLRAENERLSRECGDLRKSVGKGIAEIRSMASQFDSLGSLISAHAYRNCADRIDAALTTPAETVKVGRDGEAT